MTTRTLAVALRAVRDATEHAASGEDLFEQVSSQLRRVLPFDGATWFATDPSTVLATLPVRVENVADGHCETFWEREHQVEDVLLFRDLARSDAAIGTLYHATAGTPDRSARAREFLRPQGYGDELRAAFRTGASTWGVVALFREQKRKKFTDQDTRILGELSSRVAHGLRRLTTRRTGIAADSDAAGTLLYDANGGMLSLDATASRWLTELAGPGWADATPELSMISAAVTRAPMVAAGREGSPAVSRMRARSGRWLVVHASSLHRPDGSAGPIAVTIGPAKSSQIAPIIIEAYGLTPREQDITQDVARGLSNAEIAVARNVSPYTVRDHLKAVFAKVGVSTRGELVAKLFADHYQPTIHAPGAATHAAF
ncbi:helix-turn-helix transcriptional regulator [Nocardioides sp. GXZ039]|uniref:helix-turn-helix transcriptional regulator n=1 Tax=Nocardioides sp. GXZ039 TaxID=3136018 RepID=UPI0030F403E6